MKKRTFVTAIAIASAAIGAALTVDVPRTHAQNLPLDECASVGNASPLTRVCMHTFSDHSKCVVAVTPGKPEYATTQLACKIT
jgi:hypothetical protein